MALIDYVKKFRSAIYPFYFTRSFLQGLRAMAVACLKTATRHHGPMGSQTAIREQVRNPLPTKKRKACANVIFLNAMGKDTVNILSLNTFS